MAMTMVMMGSESKARECESNPRFRFTHHCSVDKPSASGVLLVNVLAVTDGLCSSNRFHDSDWLGTKSAKENVHSCASLRRRRRRRTVIVNEHQMTSLKTSPR
jgi:hypothetical protein